MLKLKCDTSECAICRSATNLKKFNSLYTQSRPFTLPEKKSLLKTLWEKEEMLVISIFSFSCIFSFHPKMNFYFSVTRCIYFCRLQIVLSIWTGLKFCHLIKSERVNPFQNKPWFLHICSTSLGKTRNCNKQVISTHLKNFVIFIKSGIVVYKLFQFGRVQKLSSKKD